MMTPTETSFNSEMTSSSRDSQVTGLGDSEAPSPQELREAFGLDAPSWAEEADYFPCGEEEATHLVVGVGEVTLGKHGGGVLAYCDNEFQAYRCAREIRKNPEAQVKVFVNSHELREQITLATLQMIAENVGASPTETA